MAVEWGILRPADIGGQFQQGYQNALALREHQQDRSLQMQQRQLQQQTQITERHRNDIRLGARIIRQINPTDEAGWQRARMAAQQAGIDMAEVPQQFDPNYVQQLLAVGQQLDGMEGGYTLGAGDVRYDGGNNVVAQGGPDVTHQPNIQREADYYRSIGRDDLAQQLLRNHAEGAPVVFDINGDGAPDLVPRSYFNGGGGQAPAQPRTATNPQTGERIQYNEQTGQWEPLREAPAFVPGPGGPASAPGTFPQ